MRSYIGVSLRVSYKPCVYEAEAATGSLLTGSRFRVYTHTAPAATASKLCLRACRQGLYPPGRVVGYVGCLHTKAHI